MMFGKKRWKPLQIQTLVGTDASIEGGLKFDGGCHIDGVVNGGVTADRDPDAYLSISEQGRVNGNVKVQKLSLSGTVEGDVVVLQRAELGPTARVVGNVHYNVIEIAAGAQINGKLIHQRDTSPMPAANRSDAKPEVAPVVEAALQAAGGKQTG